MEAKGEIESFCQNKINAIASAALVEYRDEILKLENPVDIEMEWRVMMSLVFDKHEIEMKPLHDLLRENKMDFTQFLRTVNFVRDMTQEQLNDYIEAYKNGEFDNHGWY